MGFEKVSSTKSLLQRTKQIYRSDFRSAMIVLIALIGLGTTISLFHSRKASHKDRNAADKKASMSVDTIPVQTVSVQPSSPPTPEYPPLGLTDIHLGMSYTEICNRLDATGKNYHTSYSGKLTQRPSGVDCEGFEFWKEKTDLALVFDDSQKCCNVYWNCGSGYSASDIVTITNDISKMVRLKPNQVTKEQDFFWWVKPTVAYEAHFDIYGGMNFSYAYPSEHAGVRRFMKNLEVIPKVVQSYQDLQDSMASDLAK